MKQEWNTDFENTLSNIIGTVRGRKMIGTVIHNGSVLKNWEHCSSQWQKQKSKIDIETSMGKT